MTKTKVVAYIRVSTNSKDQANSFENQRDYFLDRFKDNIDEELIEIYADRGITATSMKRRDEFKRMLYDAGINEYRGRRKFTYEVDPTRKPKFNKIYVRNTSRFARDAAIIEVLRELVRNKVYVHFLDIDLLFDGQDKEFMLNLFINFAQQESVDRSKKVRDGNEVSAMNGVIRIGGLGLYGYKYHPETKSLSIIEQEAEVIRKVYELYLNGYGIRRILNWLEQNGYRTRDGKERFSINMIKNILTNEKYYGCNVRNKWDNGTVIHRNSYPKLKPEKEWVKHENAIPAIIDKETFDKAQEIRVSKRHHKNQRGVYKGVSEYAGLLKCAQCDASYVRNIDRGRIFYNCATKKARGTQACKAFNINLSDLEEAVAYFADGGVKETIFDMRDNYIQHLEKIKKSLLSRIDNQAHDEAEQISQQIDTLKQQQSKLLDLFLSDSFDKETLEIKSEEISNRVAELQTKVFELTRPNDDIYNEVKQLDDSIDSLKKIKVKKQYTKEEILELVEQITFTSFHEVHDAQTGQSNDAKGIMIHFKFKLFELVNKIVDKYEGMDDLYINKEISYMVNK